MASEPGLVAVESEVDAEDAEFVEVPLCDTTVRIKPVSEWRSSAVRVMRSGDLDSWAEKALYGDDYELVWTPLDPTMAEANACLQAWSDASGQSTGKSPRSTRSSKRTGKR